MSDANDLNEGVVFHRENGEATEKALARLALLAPWMPPASARTALSASECNGGEMVVFDDHVNVVPRGMRNNIERLRQCGFATRTRGDGIYTLTRDAADRMAAKAAEEAESRKPENVRVFDVCYSDQTKVAPSRRIAISLAAFALSDSEKKIESVEIVTRDGSGSVHRREVVRLSIEVTFDAEATR
jgi:hypothetical protein